jgi:hypothetical protein
MPANYSVIAENELTYVDGGAFKFYVEPITDGQILVKNVVEYIGNTYTGLVLDAFIGTWFQDDGQTGIAAQLKKNVGDLFTRNVDVQAKTPGKVLMGVTNAIGVASGIYLLGISDDTVQINTIKDGVALKKVTATTTPATT